MKNNIIVLFLTLFTVLTGCDNSPTYRDDLLTESKVMNNFKINQSREIVGFDWTYQNYVIYHKIGEVKRMFVGHISDAHYNSGKGDKVTFSVQKTTKEIESLTYNVMSGFVFDISASATVNLPVNFPQIEIFGGKALLNVNANYSTYRKETLETYIMRENSSITGWQRELDFSEYEKGYFYSIGLFRDYDVFQKTIVNADTNKMVSASYIYAISSEIDGIEVVQSKKESLDFSQGANVKFTPVVYDQNEFSDYVERFANNVPKINSFTTSRPVLDKNILNLDMSYSNFALLNNFTEEVRQIINVNLLKTIGRTSLEISAEIDIEVEGDVEVYAGLEILPAIDKTTLMIEKKYGAGKHTLLLKGTVALDDLITQSTFKIYVKARKTTILVGGVKFLAQNRFTLTQK